MSNFIRVLRNGTLYSTREIAKTNLETQLGKLQDGEICLASYGASWDKAKTILGVVRTKGATPSYTIFDNEDIAGIVAKIGELDATVRGNLTDGDVIQTGKHVGVKVVEEDGKLTEVKVVESDIASAALLGTKDDATTVDTAFGRIAKEVAERKQAITDAIAALDSSVAATAAVDEKVYSVLTGVTQVDGKLTGKTEVTLAAVAKTGLASDVATTAIGGDTTHVAVAGTNVSDQITDIAATLKGVQNSIAAVEANALNYRTVKVDVSTLTDNSNVKEAYQVVAYTGDWAEGKGTPVGEVIRIYKDATIHKIYLGYSDDTVDASNGKTTTGTADETKLSLNYVYIKADGTFAMASVPVGNFLRQSEFKNGLQVAQNGEVSVKVDTTSEGFLTVGEGGIKLSGVQNAIDTAIAGLDATETGTDGKVSVTVAQTDGKVSGVTVTTPGLASEAEVVKSVTVNEVTSTFANNNASLTIKGGNIAVADTYTATDYPAEFETKVGADNHIKANDKIDAALKKAENTISVLATEVISNEKVTTAAVSKLAESAGVVGTDSVIGYQKKTDANYISTATSVHDATVKLDAAIKDVDNKITTLDGAALKSIEGSNAIGVTTKASNSQTVSLKLGTGTTGDNALVINADGLYLSNVWDCGEY